MTPEAVRRTAQLGGVPNAAVHVLVTSYNRRRLLQVALDSVLSQTFEDLHVLVIDDASTDGTHDLVRAYEKRFDGRLTPIIKRERRNYVDSVNQGLAMLSSARHVAFLNDDDYWHPEKLEAQMNALSEEPSVGLIFTEAVVIGEEGKATGQLFSDVYWSFDVERPAFEFFLRGHSLCLSSALLTREALELIEPYDVAGGGCNDLAMWLAVSAHVPVRWLPEPLTYYRHSATQMVRTRTRQMEREAFSLRETAVENLPPLSDIARRGRLQLDSDGLFWMAWYVRRWQWRDAAWFARRVLGRRRARLSLLVAYLWLKSSLLGLRAAAAPRVPRRPASSP